MKAEGSQVRRRKQLTSMKVVFNASSGPLHANRLKGKVAIVTASTAGIGLAIAKRLAEEGAHVVISSRRHENVINAVQCFKDEGLQVEGTVCHVGNAAQRKAVIELAIKQFGGIDILVSNAAVNPVVAPAIETDEKIWDKIFDINVKCSWLFAKEVIPHMKKRGGGSIVFISSIGGYQPIPPLGVYGVTKSTLFGLTKAIAFETLGYNIRSNCVAPGIVETKFATTITTSTRKDEILGTIPMNRWGTPSEIAGAVAYLASDDASYVTSETITVAGGMHSRL